jgi:hypothetical protein
LVSSCRPKPIPTPNAPRHDGNAIQRNTSCRGG